MTRLGFTGTSQRSFTPGQTAAFTNWFSDHPAILEIHHGDCVGMDASFHDAVRGCAPGVRIVIRPPTDPKKRAFCRGPGVSTLPPKPYLDRNKDIAEASDFLLAAPSGFTEVLRSGTWATVRAARRLGKPVWVLWPDGRIELEWKGD